MKALLKLTNATAGVGSIYINASEIVAFGDFFEKGTTVVLKNEARDILVKETPDQIAESIKSINWNK